MFKILISLTFFFYFHLLAQTTDLLEREYSYQILARIEHNPNYFTQGLEWDGDHLYESTGLYGESKVVKYRSLLNPQEVDMVPLGDDVFAEDITLFNGEIYLLTWKNLSLIRLDKQLKVVSREKFPKEGWGITDDGVSLITSDGSDQIIFREWKTLKPIKILQIKFNQKPLQRINALEYANEMIYANVWFDDHIYLIEPNQGRVIGRVDLSDLAKENRIKSKQINNKSHSNPQLSIRENVLNGIAHDHINDIFYITGKRWHYIYKVKLFLK